MKNFTLRLMFLVLPFLCFVTVNGQTWNISSDSFNSLGEIDSTVTIDGLTIFATPDKKVTVDENSKSLDGMDFTHRMKLGGSGTFDDAGAPVSRIIAFNVEGNTTITIMGMSSSSSSDRELIIAADSMNNEIGRFPALGSPISKGVFHYEGEAATIYLFSPSSGVNLYYIKAAPTIPDEQSWNISDDNFNSLGEIDTTVTVNGLTIYASSASKVTVDENSKSLDDMEFTHRLKLGGSGSFGEDGMPAARVVAFNVPASSKITVIGMSSSSSSDRVLIIAADSMNNEIGRFNALGSPISKGEFEYTGDKEATIYMFSESSGINLYYIKAEPLTTSIKPLEANEESINIYPNPATDKVYFKISKPTQVGLYNLAGSLLKQKMIESENDYMNVSDLSNGIYLLRSIDNNSFAKKLIIQ
ncbi:T9SS type A sorting domain-containing protein [Maribellus sediminis]|uniref:T9SS type A sorting domain-containing protein n=1 Tax=Maribellus sediminis TaxID=2696285 RepID=UPI0014306DC2|nr:T9SS type A sorting domain-containing protein [Maribellus sediminis]